MQLIRPSFARPPLLSPLLAAALALGLGACTIAPPSLGDNEQPLVGGEGDGGAGACAAGAPFAGEPGPGCSVMASGLCFPTPEEACACAGCGVDSCAIAESFPAQAFCQRPSLPGSDPDHPASDSPASAPAGAGSSGEPGADCPFRVDGACFGDAESACSAAGCALDACSILESYPAMVRCWR